VAELERRLTELREAGAFPPTPAIAQAVRRRLEHPAAGRPTRRPLWNRRRAVLAITAALLLPAGALAAVPSTRHTILRWLRLESVVIERVPTQPQAPPTGSLRLGRPVALARARSVVSWRLAMPRLRGLGDPSVHVSGLPEGGRISLVYRRVLITQFRGGLRREFIRKSLGPDSAAERVMVGGERGYWLTGRPHQIVFLDSRGQVVADTLRLAGNVLIWTRRGVVLRLEGEISKELALRIARSMR
jgi:hypothetical protein